MSATRPEPEYIIVQPGLDSAAWLGEIIDGEPSPIGKVAEILNRAGDGHIWEPLVAEVEAERDEALATLAAVAALVDRWATYGEGSSYQNILGKQVVSVDFAVEQLRAALAPGGAA